MVTRQTRENLSQDHNLRSPTAEVEGQARTPVAEAMSTTSQVPDTEQRRRSPPVENEGGAPQAPADFTKGLTSHDLRAPVSAVHHMSTPEERTANGIEPMASSRSIETPRQPVEMSGFLGRMDVGPDVMSKGLIQQGQARKLFNLFMTCAGCFMPIFDPVMDTFDSLRIREPFCFAVILAIASCVEHIPDFPEVSKSMLQDEVKRLTAQSLFKRPATLGSIQAMLLLAAYTDEAWFAIGHALQMAKDLKLDCALQRLVATNETEAISFKEQKHLMRQVRVWLSLCFIEREIAAGTATSSRIVPVDIGLLQKLRNHPFYTASDLRATSLVEIVQIRGIASCDFENFQQEIARAVDQDSAVDRLRKIEKEYRQWLEFWDDIHDKYGFDHSSFQRASIRGQKNWAVMFTGCAILGRLQKEAGVTKSSAGELEAPSKELVTYIVSTALEQLRFILRASDYKWNLRWATNYSALSVTFAVVFVLNAARIHEKLFDRAEILGIAEEIAQAERDGQSMAAQQNDPCTQESTQRMADHIYSRHIPGNEPPASLHSDLCLETLLDDHLQDADWMLEPSSITALNFPGEENTTILDQDFSLGHDLRSSTYQGG
ncbi:hypothetical protein P170DRAFT_489150 [Aspergillus steynii IBT 23096]|uniref:Transcription factor domain-containing protein n=1 Tax=Aspergillus steynii IBT 23096 TaxID=1392250 RepID=A0A2I2GHY5_9EURO|nr:uncharacterized protein P170DRAFT_489150 [Aspergillus steynii IBT 23096]PLB52474.1 hypothetical protein P170DRAFT_489150 [Aspergillus steynii IBT 23096]